MKLWQTIVASILSSVIGGSFILLFTRAGQHYDNNEAILAKKADIEYVDKQDKAIKDGQAANNVILMQYLKDMSTNISDIKADIRVIKTRP